MTYKFERQFHEYIFCIVHWMWFVGSIIIFNSACWFGDGGAELHESTASYHTHSICRVINDSTTNYSMFRLDKRSFWIMGNGNGTTSQLFIFILFLRHMNHLIMLERFWFACKDNKQYEFFICVYQIDLKQCVNYLN